MSRLFARFTLGLCSAAAMLLALSCARAPTPRLIFPEGRLQVTARSTRPAVAIAPLSVEHPAVTRTAPGVNALNLPVPGLRGAMTPVHATAEAQIPSAVLDARLAVISARERARLEALTESIEQMNQWQGSGATLGTEASPDLVIADLSSALRLRRTGDRFLAELLWTPEIALRTGRPQAEEPPAVASSTPSSYQPLTAGEQREMQAEAQDRAMESLRRILERTEVAPGETLSQWMQTHDVSGDSLDNILERESLAETEFSLDEMTGVHICNLRLIFDYQGLSDLR